MPRHWPRSCAVACLPWRDSTLHGRCLSRCTCPPSRWPRYAQFGPMSCPDSLRQLPNGDGVLVDAEVGGEAAHAQPQGLAKGPGLTARPCADGRHRLGVSHWRNGLGVRPNRLKCHGRTAHVRRVALYGALSRATEDHLTALGA
jgi:hypothetical protein